MKNLPTLALLLTLSTLSASAAPASPAATTEPNPENWGIRDVPRLATPTGLAHFAQAEVRNEKQKFQDNLRGVREGRPESLLKLGFTGARLAHVDGGQVVRP